MVLFGGLWTTPFFSAGRGRHKDDDDNAEQKDDEEFLRQASTRTQYGSVQQDDQDAPSLTSDFNVDSDWHVLRLCAIYTASYIVIAVVAFSFVFEKWSIIDSIYFAVATFTTVGYGDFQPTTEPGQLFTIFFATYGVIILGIFIGVVGHTISESQSRTIRKLKNGRQQKLLTLLFRSDSLRRTERDDLFEEGFLSDHVSLMEDVRQVCRAELPEILAVALLAYILGVREGWSFTSTMYFCIMSASTTGFGDYTPHSQIDKLYCVFFLPIAVAVFGEVLGRIATTYIRRKTHRAEQMFLKRSITLCDIRRMDTNRDGMVDLEEFVCFMLVALQKVDQESIDELRAIFHSLDTNGNGVLEKNDLVELTEKPAWQELQLAESIRKVK